MINGVPDPDPALNGTLPITVTGSVASPDNTPPSAAPTTANFTAGVATISVQVVNAAPTTLTVTGAVDGVVRTGSSPAVAVKATASNSLSFAVACPTESLVNNRKWASGLIVRDVYGNHVAGTNVTLSFNPAVGGSGAVRSLDWTGWTTVTSNASYTSKTDESGNTPSFTATGQNNTGKQTTVTAQMVTGTQKIITCVVFT